jgi:hypothetical protein
LPASTTKIASTGSARAIQAWHHAPQHTRKGVCLRSLKSASLIAAFCSLSICTASSDSGRHRQPERRKREPAAHLDHLTQLLLAPAERQRGARVEELNREERDFEQVFVLSRTQRASPFGHCSRARESAQRAYRSRSYCRLQSRGEARKEREEHRRACVFTVLSTSSEVPLVACTTSTRSGHRHATAEQRATQRDDVEKGGQARCA